MGHIMTELMILKEIESASHAWNALENIKPLITLQHETAHAFVMRKF